MPLRVFDVSGLHERKFLELILQRHHMAMSGLRRSERIWKSVAGFSFRYDSVQQIREIFFQIVFHKRIFAYFQRIQVKFPGTAALPIRLPAHSVNKQGRRHEVYSILNVACPTSHKSVRVSGFASVLGTRSRYTEYSPFGT